jgi:hypothetical protein
LSEHVRGYFARLAGGGSIDGSSAAFPQISLPQIDLPTLDYGDIPDLGSIGGGTSEALHHVTIDLGGGREVNGLRAPTDVLRQMTTAARDSANASIGRAPSWVRGR